MTVKTRYDLRLEDGAILHLPPCPPAAMVNLSEPDVFAESERQLYPIGSLLWYPGMGKKYRYAKAGGALLGVKHLVCNANYTTGASTANLNGFYDGGGTNTCLVGATELTFTDTIDRVKDYYQGAHLLHYDGALNVCFEDSYIISGPPAATTTPWSTTVQLHKPKKYAKLTGHGIEIWLNPYSNIQMKPAVGSGEEHVTFLGVPPIPVQDGYWFWLQTAGPVFVTPNGWTTLLPGYAADSRICTTISGILTTRAAQPDGHQIVGVLLCRTSDTHGAAWMNMSLDLGD